ncbi:MAG: hypothetical protein NC429_16215 [Lachnospiraceae bacterium]|nr:hypothetical protein [Lachnospiraceae bacterium]
MLGKLMKHEWTSVWKIPTLLIGILLLVTLLCGATFALPVWDSGWIGLPLSAFSMFLMYYMAIIVCSIGTSVYLAVRFYKSMFTDEGYLTHTLPATSHQLLLSKVITMSIWYLIASISIIISIVMLVGSVAFFWMDNFSDIGYAFRSIMHEMAQFSELDGLFGLMVTTAVMIIVSTFSGSMTVVGAVSIGQMLRKHRVLGAIGAYFGINMVMQTVSTIVMFPVMFGVSMSMDESNLISSYILIYWIITLISLAVGVGLYFLSEYLIRRQLDLE